MKQSIFSIPFSTLAVVALALPVLAVPRAWSGEPIDQTVPASADGALSIDNVAGNVSVRGWDRNEVQVTGVLGDGAERVAVESHDGRVSVRVILPRNEDSEGTALVVKAPVASRLEITTVSADVDVSNIAGRQRIATVSGDVEVSDAGEQLELKSVSGDVMVKSSGSTTESILASVSGDVIIRDVTGRVNGKSVSGDVLITGTMLQEVRLASTSGDLRIAGSVGDSAGLFLQAISGDISILVDGGIAGEFDLRTTSGDISNCFGPEPEEPEYGPGATLRFSEAGGSAEVRATTMSGDIKLCRD